MTCQFAPLWCSQTSHSRSQNKEMRKDLSSFIQTFQGVPCVSVCVWPRPSLYKCYHWKGRNGFTWYSLWFLIFLSAFKTPFVFQWCQTFLLCFFTMMIVMTVQMRDHNQTLLHKTRARRENFFLSSFPFTLSSSNLKTRLVSYFFLTNAQFFNCSVC